MCWKKWYFHLRAKRPPVPVGRCMFSCLNRILGSRWVDDTITPSDLHAPAPRLWRALQICPHLSPNRIYPNRIKYFTHRGFNSRQNKIFQPFLGDISTTMSTLLWRSARAWGEPERILAQSWESDFSWFTACPFMLSLYWFWQLQRWCLVKCCSHCSGWRRAGKEGEFERRERRQLFNPLAPAQKHKLEWTATLWVSHYADKLAHCRHCSIC